MFPDTLLTQMGGALVDSRKRKKMSVNIKSCQRSKYICEIRRSVKKKKHSVEFFRNILFYKKSFSKKNFSKKIVQ